MRGVGGVLAVAVATLLVCCSANPHQDSEGNEGEHTGERYDTGELRQNEEYEDFLRFLINYQNNRNLDGIGGSSLLGRNLGGIGGSSLLGRNIESQDSNLHGIGGSTFPGRNVNGIGGSSLLGRNLHGVGGSSLVGRNLAGIGGSALLGRNTEGDKRYSRFVDSLGGGNFVRNLDSIGGGNFVRNLDSIGGGNFVKKNLDHIGGPNFVKKNLDSLGGGNLVRNLDSIGGGNFVRELDSIGGGNLVSPLNMVCGCVGQKPRALDHLGGSDLVRNVRDTSHMLLPYLLARQHYNGPSSKRELFPMSAAKYGYGDGYPKRNFDEIDLSGLNNFVQKRNIDEIDQTSMPFPYATKRFYHLYGPNHSPLSSFDKKRYRADYPMDEIDLSHFPIGSKRSQDALWPLR
ncbi:uncharacterized protein LOC114362339 [Ostrinia furnacalis]|uniref:uncharacterized protein LOC114362339 n=1 Tax=Ostrinia furnacalis TaxID=93504 RepID=UPI0010405FE7|nr:uncharacterized protein LOC114362339 [Ostrinia furnacalis]